MEYTKSDQEKGMEYFNRLLTNHPDYVPTYYHAGKLLEKVGKADQAIEVIKKGMEISRKAGNHHAYSELQSALNQLLDNEEE
jgi:tetratricopeptide (TPR) repeat protein